MKVENMSSCLQLSSSFLANVLQESLSFTTDQQGMEAFFHHLGGKKKNTSFIYYDHSHIVCHNKQNIPHNYLISSLYYQIYDLILLR